MTEPHQAPRARQIQAVQVVAGLERDHGGPSYSVPRLGEALEQAGVGSRICSVQSRTEHDHVQGDRIEIFHRSYEDIPLLKSLNFSRGLKAALLAPRQRFDLVHNHGLWRMPNIYAARAAQRHGVPLIISPRGMLSPAALKFSRFKKEAYWLFLQRAALKSARGFHATSLMELAEIRQAGFRQPVAVIPNGVELASVSAPANPAERYILSLGRIHPKKNIHTLIEAWAIIAPHFPTVRLKIAGPAEGGYLEVLQHHIRRLSLESVDYLGPVYGADKDALMAGADIFVLSTLTENFGNTVVESLACGVPVISTKGAPWSGLVDEQCGWWVDHGTDAMVEALREALTLPPERRREMGLNGRRWMAEHFTWDSVGAQMATFYTWILNGGAKPAFVDGDDRP